MSALIRDSIRLRKKESLLILANTENLENATILWQQALKIATSAFLLQVPPSSPKSRFLSSLPLMLGQTDVLIVAGDLRWFNEKQFAALLKHGTRIAYLPLLNEILTKRSMHIDHKKLDKVSNRLAEVFSIGQTMSLNNGRDTCLEMSIKKEKGIAEIGAVRDKGTFTILPGGKAQIRPAPGSCNGVVVVDGSIDGVGLVNEPIRLQFKDGRLARIYGNNEAQKFRDYLKANWNSTSRDLVRIGVGTNHNAKLAGDLVEDETAFGRVHLGIGHSQQAAGAPLTPDYIRVTLRNSDLEIDGRPIVRRGKMMV